MSHWTWTSDHRKTKLTCWNSPPQILNKSVSYWCPPCHEARSAFWDGNDPMGQSTGPVFSDTLHIQWTSGSQVALAYVRNIQLHWLWIRYWAIGATNKSYYRDYLYFFWLFYQHQILWNVYLNQHKSNFMDQLHTRMPSMLLPVLHRTCGSIYLDQLQVVQSLIYGCMVHAVVSAAEIMCWMLKQVLTVDNDHISSSVIPDHSVTIYAKSMSTILDAWAQIAYQQILANVHTLWPSWCIKYILAHISYLYYGHR
jgi:hypothetical protein